MRFQKSGSVGVLVGLAMAMVLGACGKDDLSLTKEPALKRVADVTQGNKTKLVGRKVDFDGLTATRVVGDYVFWAREGGAELPFMLESELNGTGAESSVQIRRGHRYRIVGTLRDVANVPNDSRIWRLMKPAQIDEVRKVGVYVDADKVTEE